MSNTLDRLKSALADRYTVENELGAGGMATVYLAQDIKHDRKVALKVLRPELAAVIGAERFLNEIKVTANLQHPNILALYDSGEADSFLYYVMPLVEGDSLADRLQRETQLPVDEAIRIGASVAAALDYAHRRGVVHRDIKPANILLHDGQALVADFGIALAVSQAGGTRLTETGLSIGTPHYMSPEQAMGDRELDGRSDVYSLGCVVYEMLTGEPPHTGPSAQAIVAKIMTDPHKPVTEARPSTPDSVAAALDMALEKLSADRFATAEAFAAALTDSTFTGRRQAAASAPSRNRWTLIAGAGVVAVAMFLVGRATAPRAPGIDSSIARFSIPTPEGNILGNTVNGYVAISRDGNRVAYVAERGGTDDGMFVRDLRSLSSTLVLRGTDGGSPVFSPDGEWLAYQVPTEVRKVRLSGGAPEVVAPGGIWDISWHTDGSILIGAEVGVSSAGTRRATLGGNYGGVTRLSADGNEPEELTSIDVEAGEVGHYFPQLLPGDDLVLTVIERNPFFGGQSLDVIDLDTGTRTTLVSGATRGQYTPSGHLVWSEDDGRLRASRLDLNRLELTGPIVTIAEDVSGAAGGGFPQFDVSDSGDLVYVPAQPRDLVMVDRTGRAESIADVEDLVHSPRISPDGRRIVMDITGVGRDIWVLDIAGGTLQKVTFTGAANDPIWTPDGRHVTYASLVNGKRGIYRVPADGSAEPDSIYWSADNERSPGSWFPDGETLLSIAVTQSGWQLETISLGEDRSPEPIANTRPEQAWPAVSPDGRWLAYQSDESGRAEVYVRPIDGSSRVLVSRDGGGSPMWHPSGREIFYRHQSGPVGVLVAASVDPGPPFRVVSRTDLFPLGDIEAASPHTNYDVHPDGDHFIMVRIRGGTELVYVQNWTALFAAPDLR